MKLGRQAGGSWAGRSGPALSSAGLAASTSVSAAGTQVGRSGEGASSPVGALQSSGGG